MQEQEKIKSPINLLIKEAFKSYQVHVEQDLIEKTPVLLKDTCFSENKKILILTHENLFNFYGKKLQHNFLELGFNNIFVEKVPQGESSKTWEKAQLVLSKLINYKFDRESLIIALGGGLIGDLAGFVASVYQRGISFIQIPTSLLSMVDASVGGKVAVNLGSQGKNLIGSFFQPQKVLVDLNSLRTLPQIEWKNGLSEIFKASLLSNDRGKFFNWLEKNQNFIRSYEEKNLEYIKYMVLRSIQIKAELVQADEREKINQRALLNLGHTFGHALETLSHYQIAHGQAVSLGIVMALELSQSLNKISLQKKNRIKKLLLDLNLKSSLRELDRAYKFTTQEIINSFYLDKKTRNSRLNFVLPVNEIGQSEIIESPKQENLVEIIRKFLSE